MASHSNSRFAILTYVSKNERVKLPLIQNYPSRKEWEVVCWEKLLKSPELFRFLIPSRERHTLVAKAYALEALGSSQSYREISKAVWLSPQTISDLKKALVKKEYESYSERKKREPKKKAHYFSKTGYPKRSSGRPRRTKYGTIYMPN